MRAAAGRASAARDVKHVHVRRPGRPAGPASSADGPLSSVASTSSNTRFAEYVSSTSTYSRRCSPAPTPTAERPRPRTGGCSQLGARGAVDLLQFVRARRARLSGAGTTLRSPPGRRRRRYRRPGASRPRDRCGEMAAWPQQARRLLEPHCLVDPVKGREGDDSVEVRGLSLPVLERRPDYPHVPNRASRSRRRRPSTRRAPRRSRRDRVPRASASPALCRSRSRRSASPGRGRRKLQQVLVEELLGSRGRRGLYSSATSLNVSRRAARSEAAALCATHPSN